LGKKEEAFVRSLMRGAALEAAAVEAGLTPDRARGFLESVAQFAGAVGADFSFGTPSAGGESGPFAYLVLHTDGASLGNPGPSGAGGVIETPDGETLEEFHEHLGTATNNVAEYEAVRIGLEKARGYGARRVRVFMDSELVANQLRGTYKIKHPGLLDAYLRIEPLLRGFDDVAFETVPREENRRADRLAQTGARSVER